MLRFIAFHAYQFLLLTICMAAAWIIIPLTFVSAVTLGVSEPILGVLSLVLLAWVIFGPFVAFYWASRLARPLRERLRPLDVHWLADGLASTLGAFGAFLLGA